jgi:hypothetical protein
MGGDVLQETHAVRTGTACRREVDAARSMTAWLQASADDVSRHGKVGAPGG